MSNGNTYTITGGPLRPHEYVTVKREMNAADEAWIQNHSASMSGSGKSAQINLTIGDIKLATLKRMIVDWKLTDTIVSPIDQAETQVQIPLSDRAIEELPRRVASYINKAIAQLNPEDDESDADFTLAANGRSAGS